MADVLSRHGVMGVGVVDPGRAHLVQLGSAYSRGMVTLLVDGLRYGAGASGSPS
jgi:hypothetical protein